MALKLEKASSEEINLGPVVDIDVNGEPMTICAWVNIASNHLGFVWARLNAVTRGVALAVDARAGKLQLLGYAISSTSTGYLPATAVSSLSLSTWHHIAVTTTGADSTGAFAMYIDGVSSLNSFLISNGYDASALYSGDAKIGNRVTDPFPFDGRIADIRVYPRALSAQEILTIHTLEARDRIRDHAGRWRLRGPTGGIGSASEVVDSGPDHLDGQSLVGTPELVPDDLRD